MFVSRLDVDTVLDRFYRQDKFVFLLLFVSSFDGRDRAIIHEIVDNANRIDRITGSRICFFYFIKESDDIQEEVKWVRDLSDYSPLYGGGIKMTMEMSDDICQHFGILRSFLPAFILVTKDKMDEPHVYSIHDYDDFERLLTPLNILHSYLDDHDRLLSAFDSERRRILSDYSAKRRRTLVTVHDVEKRKADRTAWEQEIQRLTRRRDVELSRGETDRARQREEAIASYKKKLETFPELCVCGEDESVPYPQDELDRLHDPDEELKAILYRAADRMDLALSSHEGERILMKSTGCQGYFDAVLQIWRLVSTREVRISRVIERIRREIHERGFDVFISCKSQDYALAHELYDFLVINGYKPFLADTSIKEVGIDHYTALIGEVIDRCSNMVVFATDVSYLETPYVSEEWHSFINDINTGFKPNAKIVNVLSPDIDINRLPNWLRNKQTFTTDNYKDGLLYFLNDSDTQTIQQLKERTEVTVAHISEKLSHLRSLVTKRQMQGLINDYYTHLEKERDHLEWLVDQYGYSYDSRRHEDLRLEIDSILKRLEDDLEQLTKEIKRNEYDDKEWRGVIQADTASEYIRYLEQNPGGFHVKEAQERLALLDKKGKGSSSDSPVSFSPSCEKPDGLNKPLRRSGFWDKLFNRKTDSVYSSIFTAAEVRRGSHLLVQVYLHLFEETEMVKEFAREATEDAERRDFIPLQCELKKGNKVDILMSIYGEMLLMSEKKSVVWKGSFAKTSFDYFVPKGIQADQLSCVALLSVNGVPKGEMRFLTRIVDAPRPLNPDIVAHRYNKVFISYSHKDKSKVKFLHEGLELAAVPHFFDRKYLKAGDVFPKVIQDYINTADLFILCWSKNAAKSEYVQKERLLALERAFPQVRPENAAKLRIYPLSFSQRVELPVDMKDNYHFGEL